MSSPDPDGPRGGRAGRSRRRRRCSPTTTRRCSGEALAAAARARRRSTRWRARRWPSSSASGCSTTGAAAAHRLAGDAGRGSDAGRPPDKRFTDPAWEDNPAFWALRQAYLAARQYGLDMLRLVRPRPGAGGQGRARDGLPRRRVRPDELPGSPTRRCSSRRWTPAGAASSTAGATSSTTCCTTTAGPGRSTPAPFEVGPQPRRAHRRRWSTAATSSRCCSTSRRPTRCTRCRCCAARRGSTSTT